MVPVLAAAATAVGIAAVFIETHDDPERAPSDGATMLPLAEIEPLLRKLIALDRVAKDSRQIKRAEAKISDLPP